MKILTSAEQEKLENFFDNISMTGAAELIKQFDSVEQYISYKQSSLQIVDFLNAVYTDSFILKGAKESIMMDNIYFMGVTFVPSDHPIVEANKLSRVNNTRRNLVEMSALVSGALGWEEIVEPDSKILSFFMYFKPEYVESGKLTVMNILEHLTKSQTNTPNQENPTTSQHYMN